MILKTSHNLSSLYVCDGTIFVVFVVAKFQFLICKTMQELMGSMTEIVMGIIAS